MAKTITITYDPEVQSVNVETEGFRGMACKDATKQLEAALGKVEAETIKSEAYLPDETSKIHK